MSRLFWLKPWNCRFDTATLPEVHQILFVLLRTSDFSNSLWTAWSRSHQEAKRYQHQRRKRSISVKRELEKTWNSMEICSDFDPTKASWTWRLKRVEHIGSKEVEPFARHPLPNTDVDDVRKRSQRTKWADFGPTANFQRIADPIFVCQHDQIPANGEV